MFQNYLARDGYIFNFDLKSGYHYVDIYPQHQTYLGSHRLLMESGSTLCSPYYHLPGGGHSHIRSY